jgi:membrane protein DedA with SNARE-associated domain
MIAEITHQLLSLLDQFGYLGVFLLMLVESTFSPIPPSELVMAPAGVLAQQGQMNVYIVWLLGTVGSLCGALFNYALAFYLGRPFIMKYGKYFFIKPHVFEKIETFFLKYGTMATFIGRLLPVVRHLISLPAGASKMPLIPFMTWTVIGSAIWCGILTALGYFLGAQFISHEADRWVIKPEFYQYTHWIVIGIVAFAVPAFWIKLKWLNKK